MNHKEQVTLHALTQALYLTLMDGEGIIVETADGLVGVYKNETMQSVALVEVGKINFSEDAVLQHGQRFNMRQTSNN